MCPVTRPNLQGDNMKRMKVLAAVSVVALLAATTAWAGGAACEKGAAGAEAAGHACKVSSAKMAGAGGHCDMGKGAMASGKACKLGANAMVYSFSVPTAECDHCVDGISKATMAQA